MSNCALCGEPMPTGEEMFNYHGYSGPCPKPPLARSKSEEEVLADKLQRLCCAETEGAFFDCVTDNIETILAALRRSPQDTVTPHD